MRRWTWQWMAALAIFLGGSIAVADPTPLPASPPPLPAAAEVRELQMADFLRFTDQGDAGGRLETADVVFVNNDGAVVRLVSVVHVGEADYYAALDQDFQQREVVLYEMVKPRDAEMVAPQAREPAAAGVAGAQHLLKNVLGLEHQLDRIDYTRDNFVHADLDAETFRQLQVERGETFEMLFLRSMMRAFQQSEFDAPAGQVPNPEELIDQAVRLLARPDMERQIKTLVARHLGQVDEDPFGLDGQGVTVLIDERNKAAMKVLEAQLADGRKELVLFYGAAHMPDFARRLTDLGFRPVATEWRLAWDATIRPDQPSAMEQVLRELLRAMEE